jgi:predicted  nucleic acid-binding Zn-ribbon protein
MTNTTMSALREIQKIDERIHTVRREIGAFDERLAEVEEPALALEQELSQLRDRLNQMRSDARRLERGADEKRGRAEKMDQRLTRVSNLREEAAVRTELDLIRRAIEADEHEALQLLDQIRRLELTEEELNTRTAEERASVGPRQDALLSDRSAWQSRLGDLEDRRSEALGTVAVLERRVYDSFHASGRAVVVATLLDDGACGHCLGVIPLQIQNEVRRAEGLIRCEACGVILTTEPEPELDPALVEPLVSAADAIQAAEEGEGVEAGEDGEETAAESGTEADLA